jgi:hypothetical protein
MHRKVTGDSNLADAKKKKGRKSRAKTQQEAVTERPLIKVCSFTLYFVLPLYGTPPPSLLVTFPFRILKRRWLKIAGKHRFWRATSMDI